MEQLFDVSFASLICADSRSTYSGTSLVERPDVLLVDEGNSCAIRNDPPATRSLFRRLFVRRIFPPLSRWLFLSESFGVVESLEISAEPFVSSSALFSRDRWNSAPIMP